MRFSDNAMSVILLCSYIGINKESEMKPFSLGEWNIFLDRIIEKHLEPSVILAGDIKQLQELGYGNYEIERIDKLVSRGGMAALELDELENKGIKVITMLDSDYPLLLKKRLKKKTPPVLFYAGDITLAGKIGIAVVGSRNVDEKGIEFTKELVKKASKERLIIYSGGAKGVDSISETTAIYNGSAVVSFIADSLSAKIKKKEVLDGIIQGKLLLISDVKPDSGFSAARAMNRNKYIYAASYGAFVVSAEYNKGGTWTGAMENLKNKWTKQFVWENKEYLGNLKLIEQGAVSYELNEESIYNIITKKENSYEQLNMFHLESLASEEMEQSNLQIDTLKQETDIYEVIKNYIVENIGDGVNDSQAAEQFHIAKGQMKAWLKRLCDDGMLLCKRNIYYKK